MRQPLLLVGLLATVHVALVGCWNSIPERNTPELGTVHGKITLDGKPLPEMMILFEPDDKSHTSVANSDAEMVTKAMYFVDLEGVKTGPCTARVSFRPGLNSPKVPSKYSSKSELKFEVKPGDNIYDIEMKSK